MSNSSWVSTSRQEKKPWGETWVWQAGQTIHGKLIKMDKGHRTSLKYHAVKSEVFFVLEGRVRVTFGSHETLDDPDTYPYEKRVLNPMDVLNVNSGCPYRIEALDDSKIIEVGDRVNDVAIMLEDDYNRTRG